jgi:hypothetical protein
MTQEIYRIIISNFAYISIQISYNKKKSFLKVMKNQSLEISSIKNPNHSTITFKDKTSIAHKQLLCSHHHFFITRMINNKAINNGIKVITSLPSTTFQIGEIDQP